MAIEQTRAEIISSIWKAVAQSGVDLSSVPQEDQERLVGKIADQVMIAMNTVINESPEADIPADMAAEGDEKVLWQGKPFLSMVESYVITTERLRIVRGLLGRSIENFELVRIQDLSQSQGLDERMLGIGDIVIHGQDASNPVIVLRNVSKPNEVYELLRRAWLDARKRHGLQFREYM